MRKYLEIFKTTLYQYFVYRLNFILWRVRMILNLFIIYFLWSSLYENQTILFGYTQAQMISYILVSTILSDFILSTRTVDIAGEITQGNIINYILKPVSFFKYYFSKDLADKLLNFSFSLLEIAVILLFFKPNIYIHSDLLTYLVFLTFIVLGTIISYFVSLSLSFIGFWTTEVWAPRFIYFVLIFFLSGTYFPLDILPKPIYTILLLTPFPYFYYLPTKIYLSGVSLSLIPEIVICFAWIWISMFLAKYIWKTGLKQFSFFGR